MDTKRWSGAALALAGGALANEAIVRAGYGVFSFLSAGDALTWTAALNAIGLVGMAVGLYFLLRPPEKSRRERLIEKVIELGGSVAFQIGNFTGKARPGIFGELVSLYVSMEKLGITTPSLKDVSDREAAYAQADQFIACICPLVRDRHLEEARREAPRVIAAMGAVPDAPKKSLFNSRARTQHNAA